MLCAVLGESLQPITSQGRVIASLFGGAMLASAVVFGLVVATLAFVLWRYRSSRPGDPSARHGNLRLEIIWTTAAVLLIGGLFYSAIRTMSFVEAVSTEAPLVVEIVAH